MLAQPANNQGIRALTPISPSTTFMQPSPPQFASTPPQPIGIPVVDFLEPFAARNNSTKTVTSVPQSNPLCMPQAGFSVGAMRPAQPSVAGVVPVPIAKVAKKTTWSGLISWFDFED